MKSKKILKGSPRKSGIPERVRDGLGTAKEISDALNRSLEKRGLRKPLGSKFGAAMSSRWAE